MSRSANGLSLLVAVWGLLTPVALLAQTVPGQQPSVPVTPPVVVAPPAVIGPPVVESTVPFGGYGPLPGSFEDMMAQEFAAREKFRMPYWTDGVLTAIPNTLLWEPGMAVHRDPKLQFMMSNLENYRGNKTVDTWIGGTMGIYRYDMPGSDLSLQWDIFGLVFTRLSPDDLMAADYRFGLPLTWRRGYWSGKIGYEHTSAHLGDELMDHTGRQQRSWAKDEAVIGLSRIVDRDWRIFGNIGYAVSMGLPGIEEPTTTQRLRADIGFEWYNREPTGPEGTPYVAGNAEVRGDMDGSPNLTLQAGWLWKNPYQRMGNARIYVEYYTGHSLYGQFFRDKETYASFGFSFDY